MTMQQHKVIVEPEPSGAGWLMMWDTGKVIWRKNAEAVLREVQKHDRETVRRTIGLDGCVTTLEWRNVPPGFVPPSP